MRFSDVKEKHIYNVIFDDVRPCEFDGRHLALVLKRNNDHQTFIVMPLTSESNGNGVNKRRLGQIDSLPPSLRCNETYAVFNQIRTVNANRFISLKNGSAVVESSIADNIFMELIAHGINEIAFHLTNDERIKLFKAQYELACLNKAIDLAYSIITLQKNMLNKKEEISLLNQAIFNTLQNSIYTLEQKHIDNGIQKIFDEALNDKN